MKRHLLLSVFVITALAGVDPANAELLIGLTSQNSLISFDSGRPGAVTGPVPISGLVGGDTVFGIDRRPQVGPNHGLLYAFGANLTNGSGRIYTLNESTGAASLVSTLVADPADATAPFPFTMVNGSSFGIDFNPVADRLRVVSNTGQNLRINVDNGRVQLGVPLAYEAGDTYAGRTPEVTGIAYSNNFGGATTTTLFGADVSNPDVLVLFPPLSNGPNGGLLNTLLGTGHVDSSALAGFDISGVTSMSYLSFTETNGSGGSTLYTIGGGTGLPGLQVRLIGPIGGALPLSGLAAPVGTPVPGTPVPDCGGSLLFLSLSAFGLGIAGLAKRRGECAAVRIGRSG